MTTAEQADRPYSVRDCALQLITLSELAETDTATFARECVAPVQRLLRRVDLLTLGIERTPVHADSGRYLYYDGDLSIVTSHFAREGSGPPTHDHSIWELLAVYKGEVDHTLYRQSRGEGQGLGELEMVERRVLKPLDVVVLFPTGESHGWFVARPDTWVLLAGGVLPPRQYFPADAIPSVRT